MVATTMTTRRPRTSGAIAMPAAHAADQAAGSCAAPVAPEYRRILAPAFGTVAGTGLSMAGAVDPTSVNPTRVNPISKAAVLGGTPGLSTWSPPV